MSNTGRLRLVAHEPVEEPDEGDGRHFEAPLPTARPGDRLEPWRVGDPSSIAALAALAADRRVSLSIAVVVVVERSLLASELPALGLDGVFERLDDEAARASVHMELSPGLSDYLRALAQPDGDRLRAAPRLVALPMRLTERVGGDGPAARLDPALLDSALLWERAAVLAGRTMTEWAMLRVLEF